MKKLIQRAKRLSSRRRSCAHCGHLLYRGFGPKCPHCAGDPTMKHDPSSEDRCGCQRAHPKSNAQKTKDNAKARKQSKETDQNG